MVNAGGCSLWPIGQAHWATRLIACAIEGWRYAPVTMHLDGTGITRKVNAMKRIWYVRKDGQTRGIPVWNCVHSLMGRLYNTFPNCSEVGPKGNFVCTRERGHSGPHLAILATGRDTRAIWKNEEPS